ncbi:ferredoxin-dependent glutamate synthase, partial [Monoraphidium neglectum]
AGATGVRATGAAVPVARRTYGQAARLAAAHTINPDVAEPFEAESMPAYVPNEANLVADLETILKERDACGVRHRWRTLGPKFVYVAPLSTASLAAALVRCAAAAALDAAHSQALRAARAVPQVGFIANLKGIKSHTIVSQALRALGCMEHRGACSADDDSGDGAGLMTQIPWALIQRDIPAAEEGSTG